jgi:hypothetical protein
MPRRPSGRMYPNSVTLSTLSISPDSSGDSGGRTFSTGTALRCSVQEVMAERVIVHDQSESWHTFNLFFPVAPVDTTWSPGTGTNPRTSGACQLEDQFAWNGRILVAIGTARNEAGTGAPYVVQCEARE